MVSAAQSAAFWRRDPFEEDNMLDALDRLFDGESSAVDVQALAAATAAVAATDPLRYELGDCLDF
jgi:hypothetical protein